MSRAPGRVSERFGYSTLIRTVQHLQLLFNTLFGYFVLYKYIYDGPKSKINTYTECSAGKVEK